MGESLKGGKPMAKFGELAEKIRGAPEGPARELAGVLIELMQEYFQICGDLNRIIVQLQSDEGVPDRLKVALQERAGIAKGQASMIEKVVEKIAGPIEELLG
jgi:hypothetical protein